jgi:ABC-2 type transport system permease protein
MAVWVFSWIASAVVTFFIVMLSFRWRVSFAAGAAVVSLIVLISVSTFFLTVAVGAVAALAPRSRNMCSFFVTLSIAAFCGVSVPVDFWPGWMQPVCHLLPVTHGLEAIRLVLDAAEPGAVLRKAGLETFVGLGWLAVSLTILTRFADAGRRDGSIDLE